MVGEDLQSPAPQPNGSGGGGGDDVIPKVELSKRISFSSHFIFIRMSKLFWVDKCEAKSAYFYTYSA